jgi:catechol 2,3-dioxygenase-like lactoylglutathione lyase family enzyme
MRLSYAIVFVSDMARSVGFYRETVGLQLRFESSHWTEFDTGGATLALHLEEGAPAGEPPRREVPGHCRPGFAIADLDAFHQRMIEQEVTCLQEPTETFGARLARYADPDGLAFSVSEESG